MKSRQAKIIVRIIGGIGNQLFCYAAARRLALVNNAELVLDHASYFVRDTAYRRNYQLDHFNIPCRKATFAEQLEPFSKLRRYIKRVINSRRSFEKRAYLQQEGIDFDHRLLTVKPRGTVQIEGYWQSEYYFQDIASIIREELSIVPPLDSDNLAMSERIHNYHHAVAVHVRFFDEPQTTGSNNAPTDYYRRAIAEMESIVPDAHYFIFSDQPAAARAYIPLSEHHITLVSHNQDDTNAYADLWLMTQCHHFIIANSTFSWWGAWLSPNVNKVIFAPGFEKREGVSSWGFKGLLPDQWRKI